MSMIVCEELNRCKAKPKEADRKKSLLKDLKLLYLRKEAYKKDFLETGFTNKQTDAEIERLGVTIEQTIVELKKIVIIQD